LLIKSGIIGVLLLVLQIPTHLIKELVEEREARQKDAIAEVSSKWAGRQNVTGPVMVVPYWEQNSDSTIAKNRTKHLAYFLPDELSIKANVTPLEKHRGIYKVMLYSSQINLSGRFAALQPEKLGLSAGDLLWNEAFIRMSLSDYKGLNDEVKLLVNDSSVVLTPEAEPGAGQGLSSPVNLPKGTNEIRFSSSFAINGSEQLMFTPVGKATTVNLSSAWPHPSFSGSTLPQTTEVKDSGFAATWKSMTHKQSFPQQWKDNAYRLDNITGANTTAVNSLSASAFGTNLFVPVNTYQKIMRTVKYSLLCLLLTFTAFFLIETSNKKSAHPFQYALVGLALILFYTLLLSFSEYIGFNPAYVIASVATIGLISWFVKDILESGRLATLLSLVLLLLYGYIFSILQLQDYSLLLGSVGLFITLAVVMHFSKKIQW
jgi:inner membrane protein